MTSLFQVLCGSFTLAGRPRIQRIRTLTVHPRMTKRFRKPGRVRYGKVGIGAIELDLISLASFAVEFAA